MPVHRVPKGHLHEDLQQITREGERVLLMVPEEDVWVVTTEFATEVRG